MHDPIRVAGSRDSFRWPVVVENHTRVLRVEEGRTRPGHAMPRSARHFCPLIRPETAKSASSQGGALALDKSEQTSFKTDLKDMILELYS
jgi:hypothetical protein